MAATARAPPTIASSSASHIFASKLPLLNAFSTPTPDHELNAHAKLVTSLAFSPDNTHFASGSLDKTVKVWDAATRQPVAVFMGNFPVNAVAFSSKLPAVISAGEDKTVQMWHLPTKRMLGAVTVPAAPVHAVAFAPSGRMFAVGCASGALVLFAMTPDAIANALTLASQQQQQQQQSQSQSQSAQSQSAASQSASASSPSSSAHAAASAAAAAAAVADAETDPSIIGAFGVFAPASVVIREHIADVRAVCFSTEGDFLLSGSDDRSIKMYSVAPHSSEHPLRFELLRTFDGHAGAVYGLSVAPDAVSFLSASKDRSVKLWHIETGSNATFEHADEVHAVAFSPDASAFLVGGDGERRFWDASKKGSLFPEHSTGALQCRAVAFAPDGSFMLTASHHTIRLTTNMHHARTLCRFAAWHHHELTAALSTDAWRVLTDAIRQQQALQVQRQQQHQQDQLQRQQRQEQQALQLQQPAPAPLADPPAPPAVPYTHIDHFNNREGVSFLHSAIHRSDVRALRTCLDLGADRNRPTRTGLRSPLHIAVETVCNLFAGHGSSLASGAGASSSSSSSSSSASSLPASSSLSAIGGIGSGVVAMGSSVVHSVTSMISPTSSVPSAAELMGLAIMCVSVLLDAGAAVNAQDKDLNTPLHLAVKASHAELVTCLLLAGADATIRNKSGYTPANYARSLPTLEALLRNQRENAARAALVSPAPVSNATSLLPMSQSQSQSQPQSQSQCQSQALSAQTAAPSLSPTPVSGGAASAAVGGSSLSASVPTSSAPVSLAIGGDGGAVDQTEIGSQ